MLDLKKIIKFKQLAQENYNAKFGSYNGNMLLVPQELRNFYKICNPSGEAIQISNWYLSSAKRAIYDTKKFLIDIKNKEEWTDSLSQDMFFFGFNGYGDYLIYKNGKVYSWYHEGWDLESEYPKEFLNFLIDKVSGEIKLRKSQDNQRQKELDNNPDLKKFYFILNQWIEYTKKMLLLIKSSKFKEASALNPPLKIFSIKLFSKVMFYHIEPRAIRDSIKNKRIRLDVLLKQHIKTDQLTRIDNKESINSFIFKIENALQKYLDYLR